MVLVRERVKQIEGEFRVTFDGQSRCGQSYGVYGGNKIIASPHSESVHFGDTWLVEEVLHFGAGEKKETDANGTRNVQWGPVVYVRPIRRLD